MNIDQIVNGISELNESDLASATVECVRRLGQHGRDGRLALERALDSGRDADVEEGLCQLTEIELVKQFL